MSGKKIVNNTSVTTGYQQAITGVQQYLPNRTLVLNGKAVTSKVVVTCLQAQVDAINAAAAAHTAWLQAVAKQRTTNKAVSMPMLTALRHYVAAMFGINSDQYLAFGFAPTKARVSSPEAKVIGAVKLRATRKARNTMGRKQRLGVTGTVPSAIVLNVGSAPAAAAQPAAPAPAQATEAVTTATPATGTATK